jgi:pantoate--beta-alanine ligase
MVNPHFLFLGQKDYQQIIVIKRLLQLINYATKVITVSTFREDTGLAMSSRNLRLTAEQKENAVSISKMLHYIADHYSDTPLAQLEKYATNYLLNNGFDKVDYVSIADAETLQPVKDITKAGRLIALIAAFISEIRLIDNMILKG